MFGLASQIPSRPPLPPTYPKAGINNDLVSDCLLSPTSNRIGGSSLPSTQAQSVQEFKPKGQLRKKTTKLRIARDVQAFNRFEENKRFEELKVVAMVPRREELEREESKEKIQRELEEYFPEIKSVKNKTQVSNGSDFTESDKSSGSHRQIYPNDVTGIYEDEFSDIEQEQPKEEIMIDDLQNMRVEVRSSMQDQRILDNRPTFDYEEVEPDNCTFEEDEKENYPFNTQIDNINQYNIEENKQITTLPTQIDLNINNESTNIIGNSRINRSQQKSANQNLRIKKRVKKLAPPKPPSRTKRRENNNFVPDLQGKGICGVGFM